MNAGDSHRCPDCAIDFARSQDAATHREAEHHERPKGEILKAIERLRAADRDLLDKLSDT
jgi:hypothetical protein